MRNKLLAFVYAPYEGKTARRDFFQLLQLFFQFLNDSKNLQLILRLCFADETLELPKGCHT